ncbi:Fanconi anemia group M protein [Galdieria sulphuraria]|nr:Fanconi anemia group M protein [Galdieria sulphuraria]
MDLLSDEQLWKILEDDAPFVVDPEEYALLEKLEKNARKDEDCERKNISRNTQNSNFSLSTTLPSFTDKVEDKETTHERRVAEDKFSEPFECIEDDLLVFALDSFERQYGAPSEPTELNLVVEETQTWLSAQTHSNEENHSKRVDLTKSAFLCQFGDNLKQQSIEKYVPTCRTNSSVVTSSNSPVELVSPRIRKVQRTLDGVMDSLWFPSKSSKKLPQNVALDLNAAIQYCKTFIAAVVMYNFLRWYPDGKVVFMAPTKPLVRQQIAACYRVVGIPIESTAEITGAMKTEVRKTMWKSKNVFFVTPQVMKNDIDHGICPASKVICVVFDEAHKATGKYVYCSLVEDLNKATGGSYRILALSATPGNTISVIQQVIDNLQIAKVEFRSEDDPDTKPYTFHRQIESIIVPLGADLQGAKDLAMDLLSPFLNNLCNNQAFYERCAERVSIMKLLTARETWKQKFTPQTKEDHAKRSFVLSQFSLAVSLCYGINLLYSHGLAPFDSFLESFESESKQRTGGLKKQIANREKFKQLRSITSELISRGVTHPKALKCVEVLKHHFSETSTPCSGFVEGKSSTRAIVFAQYRESVVELRRILAQYEPLIHAMCFVGQAPSANSHKSQKTSGMSQKEQIEVLREFRKGTFNVLVSTSIGEEGLDIADVDLIISYDVISSPIRMLQRMGRTGRARAGQIVVLLTEGCEETRLCEMNKRATSIAKSLRDKLNCFSLYENSPRMIPTDGTTIHCERKELSIEDIRFSGEDSIFPLHFKNHRKKNASKDFQQQTSSFASAANTVESMFLESYGLDIGEAPQTRLSTKCGIRKFFSDNISGSVSVCKRPNASKLGSLRAQTVYLIEQISSGFVKFDIADFSNNEVNENLEDSQRTYLSESSNYLECAFPGLLKESQINRDIDDAKMLDRKAADSGNCNIYVGSESLVDKSSVDTVDSLLEEICSPPDEKLEVNISIRPSGLHNSCPSLQEMNVEGNESKELCRPDQIMINRNDNVVLDAMPKGSYASDESSPILRVKKRRKQEKQQHGPSVPSGRKRVKAPRSLRFIQSQASISSDDVDDEGSYEDDELGSLADFLVEDSESQRKSFDENNSDSDERKNVNMHSIYLRSLRSPENHKLGFVSPPRL